MASKKIYKHHERTTQALAEADAQTRELVLSSTLRSASVAFSDGNIGKLNPMVDLRSFGTLAQALTAIGATEICVSVTSEIAVTTNATIPSNVAIEVLKGGSFAISTGVTLTINGSFNAGQFTAFTGLGTVAFGLGSVDGISPYWRYGGRADGVTDSSDSLVWAAGYASTQYSGIPMDLGGGQWIFTKTIRLVRPVRGSGWVLLAKGDGSQFKWANNPYTLTTAPAPTGGDYGSTFGCCIVLQDGGRLCGGVVTVVEDDENNPTLDVIGNYGIWLVNLEGNFGKNPLEHVRINGFAGGRNLGMCISRYNTTSKVGPFGGSYFVEGFKTDSNNIVHFQGIFCEFIRRGGIPFQFQNTSHCSVDGLWTEGVQAGMVCFYVNSCSNMNIKNLTVGEPEGGVSIAGTAANTGDVITFSGTAQSVQLPLWSNGDCFYFDTVVSGLTTTTLYFLINKTSTTAQVSLTSGGSAVAINADGAVVLRKAPAEAVRANNSSDIDFKQLKIETGARWRYGRSRTTGTSARILEDGTYEFRQAVAGATSGTQKRHTRVVVVNKFDLSVVGADDGHFIGFVPNGTKITFTVWGRTGTFPLSFDLNILINTNSGYVLKDTIPVTMNVAGGPGTVVTYDSDQEGSSFILPDVAGVGLVDMIVEYNLCYSDALVP